MSSPPAPAASSSSTSRPPGLGFTDWGLKIAAVLIVIGCLFGTLKGCSDNAAKMKAHDAQVLAQHGITTPGAAPATPEGVQAPPPATGVPQNNPVAQVAKAFGINTTIQGTTVQGADVQNRIQCDGMLGKSWTLQPHGKSGDSVNVQILFEKDGAQDYRTVSSYSPNAMDGEISFCSLNDPTQCISKDNPNPRLAGMTYATATNLKDVPVTFVCEYTPET